jgi:ABC-type antimicrobial peptide transport system permease subunit
MAPKSLIVLAAALLVVIVAAGQVPRGAALGASTNINSSVLVSGIVPCAAGNFINASTAPAFPSKHTLNTKRLDLSCPHL